MGKGIWLVEVSPEKTDEKTALALGLTLASKDTLNPAPFHHKMYPRCYWYSLLVFVPGYLWHNVLSILSSLWIELLFNSILFCSVLFCSVLFYSILAGAVSNSKTLGSMKWISPVLKCQFIERLRNERYSLLLEK